MMERVKKPLKKVDTIFTSDWHIRETPPVCRMDNFCEVTQWRKIDFISELQVKYNCPVYHAGDLFHHWKPSPALLSETINHLPDQFYTVYGNHDLPQHNLELKEKCGIYTLYVADKIHPQCKTDIEFLSWNEFPKSKTANIIVWHKFVANSDTELWPGAEVDQARALLRKYPQFDVILTGDNHQPFVEEYQGRILVNPGSLSRQKSSETHKPRVYLYHAEDNTVTPVFIPIEENVISREHLEIEEQRSARMEKFISTLDTELKDSDKNTWTDFEENLRLFELKNPKINKSVIELTYKAADL
jgi:DNA repair exonuclease SbcCD nuclease subunit